MNRILFATLAVFAAVAASPSFAAPNSFPTTWLDLYGR